MRGALLKRAALGTEITANRNKKVFWYKARKTKPLFCVRVASPGGAETLIKPCENEGGVRGGVRVEYARSTESAPVLRLLEILAISGDYLNGKTTAQ